MSVHGDEWGWDEPRNGEHFRRCAYCGSVHPDDLVAEPTWRAEWADRKHGWPHKFYVQIPNRDPDRLYCTGKASADYGHGYIPFAELTPHQRLAVGNSGMTLTENAGYRFGTKPAHFGKFYSLHLADPELDPEVKAAIETSCGIRFDFDGMTGTVHWQVTR